MSTSVLALVEGEAELHESFCAVNLGIHGVDFANSSGSKIGKTSARKKEASLISEG